MGIIHGVGTQWNRWFMVVGDYTSVNGVDTLVDCVH